MLLGDDGMQFSLFVGGLAIAAIPRAREISAHAVGPDPAGMSQRPQRVSQKSNVFNDSQHEYSISTGHPSPPDTW
jgi:hypothetical protein